MTDGTPDLADLCAEMAGSLDDVTSSTESHGVTYARAGTAFARASVSTLEVRLPADIADAALRTPDTAVGEDDWLRFAPHPDGQHVGDRAEAWFLTAWRHSIKG